MTLIYFLESPSTSNDVIYPSFSNTSQIENLILEYGIRTSSLCALCAFLILVSKSDIVSFMLIINYQLALVKPGISPLIAAFLNLDLPSENFR